MPNADIIRNKFWGNITDEERSKFERIYASILDKKGNLEDVSQIEEKLREIIVHEEHIRALRQDYEDKLRSFKLSEAVTTSKRL